MGQSPKWDYEEQRSGKDWFPKAKRKTNSNYKERNDWQAGSFLAKSLDWTEIEALCRTSILLNFSVNIEVTHKHSSNASGFIAVKAAHSFFWLQTAVSLQIALIQPRAASPGWRSIYTWWSESCLVCFLSLSSQLGGKHVAIVFSEIVVVLIMENYSPYSPELFE